jgi:hypothetical protein
VKNFRPPDRALSATDARVGDRLAKGMNITEATKEGDAESNMMADRDEEYNTRYGGYKGNMDAFARTKLIPRRVAAIDLATTLEAAGALEARRARRRREELRAVLVDELNASVERRLEQGELARPFDEVAAGKTDVYSAARAILDRLLAFGP